MCSGVRLVVAQNSVAVALQAVLVLQQGFRTHARDSKRAKKHSGALHIDGVVSVAPGCRKAQTQTGSLRHALGTFEMCVSQLLPGCRALNSRAQGTAHNPDPQCTAPRPFNTLQCARSFDGIFIMFCWLDIVCYLSLLPGAARLSPYGKTAPGAIVFGPERRGTQWPSPCDFVDSILFQSHIGDTVQGIFIQLNCPDHKRCCHSAPSSKMSRYYSVKCKF